MKKKIFIRKCWLWVLILIGIACMVMSVILPQLNINFKHSWLLSVLGVFFFMLASQFSVNKITCSLEGLQDGDTIHVVSIFKEKRDDSGILVKKFYEIVLLMEGKSLLFDYEGDLKIDHSYKVKKTQKLESYI